VGSRVQLAIWHSQGARKGTVQRSTKVVERRRPAEAPQSGNGRYPSLQPKQVFLESARKTCFLFAKCK